MSGSWALLGHLQQCFCKTMLGFNWNVHQQPAVCANHALNPMPSHHHPKSSPYDVNGSYKPSPSHGRVYMGLWHWVAPQKMPIPDFTAKLAKFGPPRFLTPNRVPFATLPLPVSLDDQLRPVELPKGTWDHDNDNK